MSAAIAPDLIEGLRKIAPKNRFAASLISQFDERGTLSEKQVAAAVRTISPREASKSGEVGIEAIQALFNTARDNGLKRPIFRTERLIIRPSKADPETLYVVGREAPKPYLGRIFEGTFRASHAAAPDTLEAIRAIASDPMKAATEYGRSTGECGCCGRALTDPESVAAGIGPICASKWGL